MMTAVGARVSSLAKRKPIATHTEDDDVSLERQRVTMGGAKSDLLVLHNLSKVNPHC